MQQYIVFLEIKQTHIYSKSVYLYYIKSAVLIEIRNTYKLDQKPLTNLTNATPRKTKYF